MQEKIDRTYLAEIADGDEEFMLELLLDFIEQAAELKSEAVAAVDQADAEALHRATHALKGSSASVGATSLSEAARAVDDVARQGNLSEAVKLIPVLWQELDAVFQEVAEWKKRAA